MSTETNTRAATAAELSKMVAEIDNLLSTADLAELLGRSQQTIRWMRHKRILPEPAKIRGLGLRWTREQIRDYLQSINPKSV